MRKYLCTILFALAFTTGFVSTTPSAKADPTGLALVTAGVIGIAGLDYGVRTDKIRIKQGNPAYGIMCEMNPRTPETPQCVSQAHFVSYEEMKAFYEDKKADLKEFYQSAKDAL